MDISKEIDDQLLEANDSRERAIGEYYCTDLGNCIRKTFYKYNCTESIPEESRAEKARTLRVFERGNYLHQWVTRRLETAMEKVGGSVREEISIVIPDMLHQFVIRGRIDNLLVYPDQTYEVVEVKTTARITVRDMPMRHHVSQVMPYLLYSPNRTTGSLLYLEPATFKTAQYEVPYDRFAMEDLWRRARRIHECVTIDHLPEAEAKQDKKEIWQCKYCEFSDICERHGEGSASQAQLPINGCEAEPEEETLDFEEMEALSERMEEEESDAAQESSSANLNDSWAKAKARMEEAEKEQEDEGG